MPSTRLPTKRPNWGIGATDPVVATGKAGIRRSDGACIGGSTTRTGADEIQHLLFGQRFGATRAAVFTRRVPPAATVVPAGPSPAGSGETTLVGGESAPWALARTRSWTRKFRSLSPSHALRKFQRPMNGNSRGEKRRLGRALGRLALRINYLF